MTLEQKLHNHLLDEKIRRVDQEYAAYVAEMDEKRRQYMEMHPDDPWGHLTFLVLISKPAVHGIRYVD